MYPIPRLPKENQSECISPNQTRTPSPANVAVFVILSLATFALPASVSFAGAKLLGLPIQIATIAVTSIVAFRWLTGQSPTIPQGTTRVSGIRLALMILAGWLVFSFAYGYTRDLTPRQASGMIRVTLLYATSFGVAAFVAACSFSKNARARLTDILLTGAYLSAAVAAAQFFLGFDYVSLLLRLPTASNFGDFELTQRTVTRALGTAVHPIEMSVVSGALLPLAIYRASSALTRQRRDFHGAGAFLLAFAALSTVSRSGVVAIVAAGLIYIPRLALHAKVRVLLGAVALVFVLQGVARGVLSTLRYLFLNMSSAQDPSVAGRTEDYSATAELVDTHPFFGIGVGAFQKDVYRILDNQYLGSLIETGYIGLLLLLGTFLVAIASLGFSRNASDEGRALAAAVMACSTTAAFFDLFAFRQVTTTLFILFGLAIGLIESREPRHEFASRSS